MYGNEGGVDTNVFKQWRQLGSSLEAMTAGADPRSPVREAARVWRERTNKAESEFLSPTLGGVGVVGLEQRRELDERLQNTALVESFSTPPSGSRAPYESNDSSDYDWDEKFAADPDWLTDNVPGKVVLNEVELAAQVSALGKLEEEWRKERLNEEYDDARILGWTGMAETYNSRFAMFFLVVGLLTEYWTGVTIPGQIEEMLRVGGFIGPDF